MADQVRLFEPLRGKDMFTMYPELSTIEEFGGLSNEDMIWVWAYGNVTSPYKGNTSQGKASSIAAWMRKELGLTTPRDVVDAHGQGIWNEDTIAAIERMGQFRVQEREDAKQIVDEVFANMRAMIELSEDDKRAMTGNFEEKKKYVDLAATVTKTLPMLLKFKETGFGLSEINVHGLKITKKELGRGGGRTEMDMVMNDVKDNGYIDEDALGGRQFGSARTTEAVEAFEDSEDTQEEGQEEED